MSRRKVLWTALAAIVMVAAMAYGSARASRAADEDVTLAESILRAFSTDDYAAFSASFTNALLASMDETAFEAWREPLADRLGAFVEITGRRADEWDKKEARRIEFEASFERADARFVIFIKAGTHRVSAFELESPASRLP